MKHLQGSTSLNSRLMRPLHPSGSASVSGVLAGIVGALVHPQVQRTAAKAVNGGQGVGMHGTASMWQESQQHKRQIADKVWACMGRKVYGKRHVLSARITQGRNSVMCGV